MHKQDWEIISCSLCWSRREPLRSLPRHPRSCLPSPVFNDKEEESNLYIHANGDVSHNDRKRKGSVNHVIMSVTLARPLKTLTLISSGWTVTAYNRIYIDLGLWCCDWDVDWIILDFFRGCSSMLSFPMLVKYDGFYPTRWLQGYNDFRPTRLDFARFG